MSLDILTVSIDTLVNQDQVIELFMDKIESKTMRIYYDGSEHRSVCMQIPCAHCPIRPLLCGSDCYHYKVKFMSHVKENHLHPEWFV